MNRLTMGDGCAIAYRFDGPQDAPVLMLSNSLGTSMAMWDAQITAFTRHFRVLRYDTRGHGQSDVPPGAYSLDRLGRDAAELLEGLGLGAVHFCGLSLGGMTGQWLAIHQPQIIQRLVLANTAACIAPPSSWQSRIELVLRDGMDAVADATVTRWFTPSFVEREPEEVARIRALLASAAPQGYAGACAAIRDMDMRPLVHLVATPALVIGGRYDPATPLVDSEYLAAQAVCADLVVLDAAHLSNVEQAEAFSSAVVSFLA